MTNYATQSAFWRNESEKWFAGPAHKDVQVDDTHARMSRATFEGLQNYSCSLPTGAPIGKRWKRGEPYRNPTRWLLGEYVEHPDFETVGIKWREIVIVD